MTAVAASDANARAHARPYLCMRYVGEDLPKSKVSPLFGATLRVGGLIPVLSRGDGINFHRKVAVSVDSPSPSARGTRRAVPRQYRQALPPRNVGWTTAYLLCFEASLLASSYPFLPTVKPIRQLVYRSHDPRAFRSARMMQNLVAKTSLEG